MTRLAVITPSYEPDFGLCEDLSRSMLENSPETVHHHIIVPRGDLELFARLAGPRTHIRCEAEFLPKSFVALPFSKFTVNFRRPFPPVRGWILQQVLKLAAAAAFDDDAVVLVDSDIEFIRPFTTETFVRHGVVRFYCKPNSDDERLPRHMVWHRVARELLGMRPAGPPPYPNYVSSLLAWDPAIVRRMLSHISLVTGRPWQTVVGAQRHFSEWTLYGEYVHHVIGAPADSFCSGHSLCHEYWEAVPLSVEDAARFLSGVQYADIAAMISAKSRTSLAVRRAAFAGYRAEHTAWRAARTGLGSQHITDP
jgi:Family of unknown function (DUF6492)